MGWTIGIIKNEVKITKKCATELKKWLSEKFGDCDDLDYKGKINFNSDWGEGMDFLYYPEAQEILRKHEVKGDICFGSLEGDNAGRFWGYRFNGKSAVIDLIGQVTFKPERKD